jgi:glutamate synthase (NADPH/NADH) small chain
MMKFVSLPPGPPDKRSSTARAHDFHEIYQPFIEERAASQASRCAQCGVPFCQAHCPLGNNIPDWLKLTAEGRLEEAYAVSAATNPMPEVCGRICPQDRLCEGSCVIEQSKHGAVTIGAVEKHITDTAWANGWVAPIRVGAPRGQSVGIIGAGPAGLAAAEALRGHGYDVAVYDRHDRVGGLLVYGIPNFKLEKEIVARRAQRLAEGGIVFELNCEIGVTISFAELRQRHHAVLIATGVYGARPLGVAGDERALRALDYLIAANRVGLGDDVPAFASGELNATGKHVVVIGGGDTAMDCVRTAVRQGAASVTCLYRRDRANMPGSAREVACAEEEGVRFEWLAAPLSVEAQTVKAARMRLAAADASGRRAPEPVPGSEFTLPADMIIAALGFDAENLPGKWNAPDLATRAGGAVRVDPLSYAASIDGVFAAGDIARGASLVVWAIKEGLDAAAAIHQWLENQAATARIAAE